MIHAKVTGGVLCVVHFAITDTAKAVTEVNTSTAMNAHSEPLQCLHAASRRAERYRRFALWSHTMDSSYKGFIKWTHTIDSYNGFVR